MNPLETPIGLTIRLGEFVGQNLVASVVTNVTRAAEITGFDPDRREIYVKFDDHSTTRLNLDTGLEVNGLWRITPESLVEILAITDPVDFELTEDEHEPDGDE
jgi:hypothetical protein